MRNMRDHHVIIVPGLGNTTRNHRWATFFWKNYGLTPHIFDSKWKTEEPHVQPKLDRALVLVDTLIAAGKKISLVGNSAGSSFVLNVFGERKKYIHKVVVNCGRLRGGAWPWYTFDQVTKLSPSLRESIMGSERVLAKLTPADKKKILTLRAFFDEIVPPGTIIIEGATNKVTPSVEHVISIGANMTLFSGRIIRFLQN